MYGICLPPVYWCLTVLEAERAVTGSTLLLLSVQPELTELTEAYRRKKINPFYRWNKLNISYFLMAIFFCAHAFISSVNYTHYFQLHFKITSIILFFLNISNQFRHVKIIVYLIQCKIVCFLLLVPKRDSGNSKNMVLLYFLLFWDRNLSYWIFPL